METQTTIATVFADEWKAYWFNLLACPIFDKYKHGLETFHVFVPPNVKNVKMHIGVISKQINNVILCDVVKNVERRAMDENTTNLTIILSKTDNMMYGGGYLCLFRTCALILVPTLDYIENQFDNCLNDYTDNYTNDLFKNVDKTRYENNETAYVSRCITSLLLMTICDFYTDKNNYDYHTDFPIVEMVFANDYIMQHIAKN
jgi:hypothetical protein